MASEIYKFFLNVPKTIAPFCNWLFTKLPYVNITPISLFTIGGFTVILVLHLIHLVNVIGG